MYGDCKQHSARVLAPTVLWCSKCGAHKRSVDGRWLRWSPAGVRRLKPLRARQLELISGGASGTVSALHRVPLPSPRNPLGFFCDYCGKPEEFNVLCPECERLVCVECGRPECGGGKRCEPAASSPPPSAAQLVLHVVEQNSDQNLCGKRRKPLKTDA